MTKRSAIDAKRLNPESYASRLRQLGLSVPPATFELANRNRVANEPAVDPAVREAAKRERHQQQRDQWRRAEKIRKSGIDGRAESPEVVTARLRALGIETSGLGFRRADTRALEPPDHSVATIRQRSADARIRVLIAEAKAQGVGLDARTLDRYEYRAYLRILGLA